MKEALLASEGGQDTLRKNHRAYHKLNLLAQ